MKIISAQHNIKKFSNFDEYKKYYSEKISAAKDKGAELYILPEYSGLELIFTEGELEKQVKELQRYLPEYLEFWKELSKNNNMILQPGTILAAANDGKYFNRAYIFFPGKEADHQDKLQLTAYEKKLGFISKGNGVKVFGDIFGINICYDSEFPEYAKTLAHKGVKILLVPSCTETAHGLTRVQISCRASAIQNQFYVITSSTVGYSETSDICDVSVGISGFYSPADAGFPQDGILTFGSMDREQEVGAELNLAKIDSIRRHGATHNYEDGKNIAIK